MYQERSKRRNSRLRGRRISLQEPGYEFWVWSQDVDAGVKCLRALDMYDWEVSGS